MQFDFSRYPNRVNLGCGFDKREGFLNVDINDEHAPDLVCDVTNLNVLPSSYYQFALANDILEHIPRLKTRNVVKEWNRILQINGKLELRVPSAIHLLLLLKRKENRAIEKQERIIQCLFGTQSYLGDFHYTSFTKELITDILNVAGFSVESIIVKDKWLYVVTARKVENRRVDDIFFAGKEEFIEAVYKKLLRRNPDPKGYEYYLSMLDNGISREAIIECLKNSEEYRQMNR